MHSLPVGRYNRIIAVGEDIHVNDVNLLQETIL